MEAIRDWENHFQYLQKKYHELSLDQLLESQGDSVHHLKKSLTQKLSCDDKLAQLDEEERRERVHQRVQQIYDLLRDREFFTDRQRQVLSLLFGWNGNSYVGPKTISDIAKLLGVAQPVAYNHLRLSVKKLKKHFGLTSKKRKSKKSVESDVHIPASPESGDKSGALDIG